MRAFWQFIAMLLLAAFVPATVHCLAGHATDGGTHAAVVPSCSHDCEHSKESSDNQAPGHQEHDCPTETLAKSHLPGTVLAPEILCEPLDDALADLFRLGALMSADAYVNEAPINAAPREWIATWVFVSRAALPPRAPSDLS